MAIRSTRNVGDGIPRPNLSVPSPPPSSLPGNNPRRRRSSLVPRNAGKEKEEKISELLRNFFLPTTQTRRLEFSFAYLFFFYFVFMFFDIFMVFFSSWTKFFFSSFPFKLINSMLSLHELYNSHMIRGQDSQKHIVEIFI